jgi:adenine-specific DNA-methyltransferase
LDFFTGSVTTANAIFQQNAEDLGIRKFILVQLPEPIEGEFKTIAQITM